MPELTAWRCTVCNTERPAEEEPAGLIGDEHKYCIECDRRGSIESCAHCGEEINNRDNDCVMVDGDPICERCVRNDFFICSTCASLFHNEDAYEVGDSEGNLCGGCFDNETTACVSCNNNYMETIRIDTDNYCLPCGRECIESMISDAASCGSGCDEHTDALTDALPYVVRVNAFNIIARQWTCLRCFCNRDGTLPFGDPFSVAAFIMDDEMRDALCQMCGEQSGLVRRYAVESYSYRPTFKLKRTDRDLETRALHFGTEVEIEMNSSRDRTSGALELLAMGDAKHELFYCKSDSSIDNGFELVTHPFTYDWMRENEDAFEAMFDLSKLMKGWDAPNCGMHIHMSSDAFSNLHLFKFLRFFYENRELVTSMARRPKGALEEWAPFSPPEEKRMLQYATNKSNSLDVGRGALNFSRRSTIECRIFRSTLAPTAYYGNIEFLQAMFDYTRNCGLHQLGADEFMGFARDRGKAYNNFLLLADTIRPDAINEMEE